MDTPESSTAKDQHTFEMGHVTFYVESPANAVPQAGGTPQLTWFDPNPTSTADANLRRRAVPAVTDFLKPQLDQMVRLADDRMSVARLELRPANSFEIVAVVYGLYTAVVHATEIAEQLQTIARVGAELVHGFLRAVEVPVTAVTGSVTPSTALAVRLEERTGDATGPQRSNVVPVDDQVAVASAEPAPPTETGGSAAREAPATERETAATTPAPSAMDGRLRYFTLALTYLAVICVGLIAVTLVVLSQ